MQVMIGFDQIESIAYHTLSHSILSHSSKPVSIVPVNLKNLKDVFTRPREKTQSNEFSLSRFLTPYLSNFEGWSLYLDCDMMVRGDLSELFDLADPEKCHNPQKNILN